MTPDQIIALIQALGFPICTAIALGYALWKVMTMLAASHIKLIQHAEASMEKANISLAAMTNNIQTQTTILTSVQHEVTLSKNEQQKQTKLLEELPEQNAVSMAKACRVDQLYPKGK